MQFFFTAYPDGQASKYAVSSQVTGSLPPSHSPPPGSCVPGGGDPGRGCLTV